MYNSMEDQGQHYDQCVDEIKKCKLISCEIKTSVGNTAIITFNDDQTSKILSRFDDIGHEYGGTAESHVIFMN